jgi:hypothetical protein
VRSDDQTRPANRQADTTGEARCDRMTKRDRPTVRPTLLGKPCAIGWSDETEQWNTFRSQARAMTTSVGSNGASAGSSTGRALDLQLQRASAFGETRNQSSTPSPRAAAPYTSRATRRLPSASSCDVRARPLGATPRPSSCSGRAHPHPGSGMELRRVAHLTPPSPLNHDRRLRRTKPRPASAQHQPTPGPPPQRHPRCRVAPGPHAEAFGPASEFCEMWRGVAWALAADGETM